jgi:hypothetical protein
MQAAYHTTTTVLPGNKIEIELPEGTIGDAIEVIVLLPIKPQTPKRSVLDILADAHKIPSYRTPEEIDRDIQAERDSWDD